MSIKPKNTVKGGSSVWLNILRVFLMPQTGIFDCKYCSILADDVPCDSLVKHKIGYGQ